MKNAQSNCFRVAASLMVLLQAAYADSPEMKAVVRVHPEPPGIMIPADFLGFSVEKQILAIECFHPQNAALLNLFSNLGQGVLRVGAAEVDFTYWSPTNVNPPGRMKSIGFSLKPLTIGPLSLDNLYAFSRKSGWRVIHGLNLGAQDPEMAAAEANYALQVGGLQVLALEVGNEPNLIGKQSMRPKNYSYADYRQEIESYHRAILTKRPGAPLAGPATTRFCDWVPQYLSDFKTQIVLVTSHGYALSGGGDAKNPDSPWSPTLNNLLRPQAEKEMVWLPKLEAARAAGIPWRLDEYNTCTRGGQSGVSDVFASALWNLDFMLDVAEHGGAGVNLHGGFGAGRGGYSAFYFRKDHFYVNPIYYSMLLFHQAAQGHVVPVDCQTAANFTAHAVLGNDRNLRALLINKDLTHSVNAAISAELVSTKAKAIRLAAPSASATEGITLAGSSVAADGTWKIKLDEQVLAVNGVFTISLPPASAALLTILRGVETRL